MRVSRWAACLLMLLVLVAPVGALAQTNNVVLIDRGDRTEPKELPTLLDEEEIAKIEQLQGAVDWRIISPVSPDDALVLVVNTAQEFGVINVSDGSSQAISVEQFFPLLPLPLLSPFGEGFTWVSERVVATLAVNLAAEDPTGAFAVVFLDVESGAVDGVPISVAENNFPISLAPNGASVLLYELAAPPQAGGMTRLPTTISAGPLGSSTLATPAQVAAALRAAPQLRPFMPIIRGNTVYRTMQVAETQLRLKLLDLASGQMRELGAFPKGTLPGNWSWRGDSAELALTIFGLFDPDQIGNFGRDVLDGALISEEVYRDVTGNLPPSINPALQGSELRIFDLNTGTSRGVRAADSGGEVFFNVSWAPDNNTLLAHTFPPSKRAGRTYPSYSLSSADRSSFRFYTRDLVETGRFNAPQVTSAFFSGGTFLSPDELIFMGLTGTDFQPYYYNRVSGEFRNIADRAGTYMQIVPTRTSRQLAVLYSSFTNPPDLYRMGWDGSAVTRLTWANEELRQFSQTREYPVSFTLRNGQRRPGTLILPADVSFPPRNVPILLWQEGGPGGAMNNMWLANVENPYGLLPNFGFGMLILPLSGREGNGPAVLRALSDNFNFGQIDIDEGAEISRQIISRGWTSAAKLGVLGCSYGGYYAWQSIIRYPDLYAVANPQCALVDLPTEWARGYAAALPSLMGLPPWAASAEYMRDSPSYNVSRVKAAVLSFHGTNDFLPITLNENMHLQLVNRDVPARMVKFAGAGHGLVEEEYQLYAAQEQISWFREYLR